MEFMILRKIKLDLQNLYKTLIQNLKKQHGINYTKWLNESMSDFPNATQIVIKSYLII